MADHRAARDVAVVGHLVREVEGTSQTKSDQSQQGEDWTADNSAAARALITGEIVCH